MQPRHRLSRAEPTFTGQYDRAIGDYRKALTLKIDDATKRAIERALKQLGAGS
jgi:hypothetical protein